MNADEFKTAINSEGKSSKVVNYIMCFLLLIGGFYLILKLIQLERNDIWLLPLILICFGAYGLWRTSVDFRIESFYSRKPADEKLKLILEYQSTLKILDKKKENNYVNFTYRNFFGNQIRVRTLFDEEKFLYNLQSVSVGGLGFIDFGLKHRATSRFAKYLKARL